MFNSLGVTALPLSSACKEGNVVQRMHAGITEDILIKVIDNTVFEQSMLGSGQYNAFFQFIEKEE